LLKRIILDSPNKGCWFQKSEDYEGKGHKVWFGDFSGISGIKDKLGSERKPGKEFTTLGKQSGHSVIVGVDITLESLSRNNLD